MNGLKAPLVLLALWQYLDLTNAVVEGNNPELFSASNSNTFKLAQSEDEPLKSLYDKIALSVAKSEGPTCVLIDNVYV
jgi:hypothetical protein